MILYTILILLLVVQLRSVQGQTIELYGLNYSSLLTCPTVGASTSTRSYLTSFLHTETLTCKACASGTIVASESQKQTALAPCVCSTGTYLPASASYPDCQPCATGQASSFDRQYCLACPSGVASGGYCSCPAGSILQDANPVTRARYTTYTCVECAKYEYPSDDLRTCLQCPDTNMISTLQSSGSYKCECNEANGFNRVPQGSQCVTSTALLNVVSTYPESDAFRLRYWTLLSASNGALTTVSVTSELYTTWFYRATIGCAAAASAKMPSDACQTLGNLCVLALYDETSAVCKQYQDILRTNRDSAGTLFPDWPLSLPWLYYNLLVYSQDQASAARRRLNMDVSFGATPLPGTYSRLRFVLAEYAINGTLLGLRNLTTEFQLCSGVDGEGIQFLGVGHNYERRCKLDLRNLIDKNKDTTFYDMYIVDGANSLYPVPVRIANFGGGNNGDAESEITSTNRLVRRFFMVDTISSRQEDLGGLPRYVQFAKEISLRIPKSADVAGKLDVPYLHINYETRDTLSVTAVDNSDVSNPTVSFTTTYFMSLDTFWRALSIIFSLVCMLAGMRWFYQCFSWTRRNVAPGESLDIGFLGLAIAFFCGSAGPFFAWLLYAIACYWMLFFKSQSVVYVMLPTTDGDLNHFFTLLLSAFVFQLVYVLWSVLQQCQVDVFFIDWERSRGRLLNAGNEEQSKPAPVSVWRSVFMANEWNRLQTYRRVSIEFSLVWMVFILKGLQVRYLATAQPDAQNLTANPTNLILLFCANCTIWILLAAAQIMYHFALYDRYYRNRLLQFVDLLSMANISFLCFDELSHGCYIHGRSVHVHSDTNMSEMTLNLKKEEKDMVSRRGMNNTEDQVFEIYVTRSLRETYNRVYSLLVAQENKQRVGENGRIARLMSNTPGQKTPMMSPHNATPDSVKAYESINKFLCNFVDNNLKDHRYVIREMTYGEKLAGVAPDMAQGSVFYRSQDLPFSNLTLCGLEVRMLTLYALLFTLVDASYSSSASTIAAAVVVYVVDLFLRFVRGHFGERNLAAKTLVDWRFLL